MLHAIDEAGYYLPGINVTPGGFVVLHIKAGGLAWGFLINLYLGRWPWLRSVCPIS